MNILLVEPSYERKYPPLGLMKISAWHKQQGHDVEFLRGKDWIDNDGYIPDMIYITSLFTWDLPIVVQTTKNLERKFPDAMIKIGGVAASAMPEWIEKQTGIQPHVGVLPYIDCLRPDYEGWEKYTNQKINESMVFTSRGCQHHCQYCIVRMIEPEYYEINGWERAIEPSKPFIVVFDNNILRASREHVDRVFSVLNQTGKWFDINSGFDVFLFKKEHAKKIADMKIKPIRFAFDKMNQEKSLLKCIKYCEDVGINTDKIRIYVLFNYEDDVKEARYRAEKVIELGCKPFAMNYKPLDHLDSTTHISKKWTKEQIINFSYYYNMPAIWKIMSFDEFVKERQEGTFDKKRRLLNNKLPKGQRSLNAAW